MAEIADYIGCGFGSFEIERHVAHGAEAEVYCVRDFKHDRRLILRLDPNDDELWDGDPMIPPRNRTLEVRGAMGTWAMAPSYRVGGLSTEKDVISPSVNPIEAIENAFRGVDDEQTLPRVLSFAWQSIWRSQSDATALPQVWGLAVFAGRFPTIKAEVRRAGKRELTEMIVGSPVFVQQIEATTPAPSA